MNGERVIQGEREREIFSDSSTRVGHKAAFSVRGRHVAPSTRRFYLCRPLVAILSVICKLLIHRLQESQAAENCADSIATPLPYLIVPSTTLLLPYSEPK